MSILPNERRPGRVHHETSGDYSLHVIAFVPGDPGLYAVIATEAMDDLPAFDDIITWDISASKMQAIVTGRDFLHAFSDVDEGGLS